MEDRWLSVDEAARYLGVKRDTVYKWITRRLMPAHKVGRLWKFRKQEIDSWVRSDRAGAKVFKNHPQSRSGRVTNAEDED